MASLQLEPVGCRAWLSDLALERGSDLGLGTAEGSVRGQFGQSSRRRRERPPSAIELWGELPSGLRVLVQSFDGVARRFVIVS